MKTLICVVCTLVTFGSSSQIVPKSRFIGGSVSAFYASRSLQNLEEFSASINPQFGKFLSDKWSIQSGLGYQYRSFLIEDEFNGTTEFKSRTNVIGINIGTSRFFPISGQFYFNLRATISGYLAFTKTLEPSSPSQTSIPVSAGIGPGFTYFIHPRWVLNANFGALQFLSNFNNLTSPDIYVGFRFSTFTAGLGVQYVLRPKSKRIKD